MIAGKQASRPERIGRYVNLPLEAGWDRYGSFCRDLAVESNAGADVGIDMVEGRKLLQDSKSRIQNGAHSIIRSALTQLAAASSTTSVEIFLSDDLRQAIQAQRRGNRRFRVRYERAIAARCRASSGDFRCVVCGVISRVRQPTIPIATARSVMSSGICRGSNRWGFDVLYPAADSSDRGSTNRKGKNNSLTITRPTSVGSPYAIGGADGGHDAIHSALGTIDDFRLLREA